jgi:hypothetical protein
MRHKRRFALRHEEKLEACLLDNVGGGSNHEETHAEQQTDALFDYVVGAGE